MPEVYADDRFTVEALPDLGRFANVSYIVRPADGGPATVIDVPEGFEAVLEALAGREIGAVIVTHYHRDHWDGFDVFRGASGAPAYAGAEEIEIAESRQVRRLADGERVEIGGVGIEVIHTPGHTPGSICLRAGGVVFTGDTLFPGGPGASRSGEALQQEIQSITERLYALPDETLVLPGHGGGTTVADSRAEYAAFAAREHAEDLHGDVLWASS
ncbi:MAG: MBL fold metallo-hydrolase [Chloroflexi bacterium]|nr:MBL fold metallo-hydrolase [Chloroflexota bacterium]